MFDVGFLELSVVAVVALIVLGPERLPKAARTVGLYVGKARRMLADVKADIDREIERSDLEDVKKDFQQAKSDVKKMASDVSTSGEAVDIKKAITDTADTLNQDAVKSTDTNATSTAGSTDTKP